MDRSAALRSDLNDPPPPTARPIDALAPAAHPLAPTAPSSGLPSRALISIPCQTPLASSPSITELLGTTQVPPCVWLQQRVRLHPTRFRDTVTSRSVGASPL
ncbi:hypothetical protein KM043_008728 [Ampulex compressa]|nr:hypothetical protein KM043_008728 [Ampulex compressa]